MAKDILKAPPIVLAGKTSAKGVATALPERTGPNGWPDNYYPRIRYRLDGMGRESADLRVKTRRIVFECISGPGPKGHTEANRLQLEIEEALIPPERIVHGFQGWADDVWIDNVTHDFGPSWVPDPQTGEARYIAGYMFTFW